MSCDPKSNPYCLAFAPSDPYSQLPINLSVTCPDTYKGQQPNIQTGQCEPTPLDGFIDVSTSGAAVFKNCVNPCVRLANGKLAVTKNSVQCRVFPNTSGSNPSIEVNGGCPTVCPAACVELWDSCPAGTGPLTTIVHTKDPNDVLALSGSTQLDGSANPLWPVLVNGQVAYQGKPYTECYAYNTQFCELPLAQQARNPEYVSSVTTPTISPYVCYAQCPTGTKPSPTTPNMCLFATFTVGSATVSQAIMCPPQYFVPEYGQDSGKQIGCKAIPLPVKGGTTCPAGFQAYVNEQLTLEWCMPECPAGYVQDVYQNTCLATCQGSTPPLSNQVVSQYILFQDYVEYYAHGNRCKDSGACAQDNVPGMCRARRSSPQAFHSDLFGVKSVVANNLVHHESINDLAALQGTSRDSEYQARRALLGTVAGHQRLYNNRPSQSSVHAGSRDSLISCPAGMCKGETLLGENPSLCYDKCSAGYTAIISCRNGGLSTESGDALCPEADRVFQCMADCPAPNEGLGLWTAQISGNAYYCDYQYPNGNPPADPSLWKKCPSDGRFHVLESSSSDAPLSARLTPMCMRKSYMRVTSCPSGFGEIVDSEGRSACVESCSTDSILVPDKSGALVCQSACSADGRYTTDALALIDDATLSQFKDRVCTRRNFSKGLGVDPQADLAALKAPAAPAPKSAFTGPIYVALALVALFLFFKVVGKR